jgi:flagellar biosynthesis regulator FlaF
VASPLIEAWSHFQRALQETEPTASAIRELWLRSIPAIIAADQDLGVERRSQLVGLGVQLLHEAGLLERGGHSTVRARALVDEVVRTLS